MKKNHSEGCIEQYSKIKDIIKNEINIEKKETKDKEINQNLKFKSNNTDNKNNKNQQNEIPENNKNILSNKKNCYNSEIKNEELNLICKQYYEKIYNVKMLDEILKKYYKSKQKTNIKQSDFIKIGTKIYTNTNSKNYFKLTPTHFKNLFSKQKNEINPTNISEIFQYSKIINNLGELCRGYEEKILIYENKEKYNHKHMIFFLILILKEYLYQNIF